MNSKYLGDCVLSGNIDDVKDILKNGSSYPLHVNGIDDKDFSLAVQLASLYSKTAILKILLDDPRILKIVNWRQILCRSGNLTTVKFILNELKSQPIHVKSYLNTAIEEYSSGSIEILKYLLDEMTEDGVPARYMEDKDNKALFFAAQDCKIDNVKLLLKDGRFNFASSISNAFIVALEMQRYYVDDIYRDYTEIISILKEY